jgi:hypothetical protein
MADIDDDDGAFGPSPTRDQLIHMMQLFYESIVACRDELAMLRDERVEGGDDVSALHREDLERCARDIDRLWVEAYAIGRRTGFIPPPPPPADEPADRRH